MNDIVYRNIFPNNNIPKIKIEYKEPTFEETLSSEVQSLIAYANLSRIIDALKELEFNIKEENDPINILLKKLKEVSELMD
jgi:hypothetical protein